MFDYGLKLKHEHGWIGRLFWQRLALRQVRYWRWRTALSDAMNNSADAAADYLIAEGAFPRGWSLRRRSALTSQGESE